MSAVTVDKQFKNILVVYSPKGSNTLQKAAQMAAVGQARLTIVDVVEDLDSYRELLPPTIGEPDLQEVLGSERRSLIREQLGALGMAPDELDIRIRFGTPVVEIIREVIASGHDLVIKTATGGARMFERLFGSTAMKLLRKCPSPVWIVKPDHPIGFARILAAVDPMPASHRSDDLNHHILQAAAALARMDDGHIDIVHAWHLPGEATFSSGRTRIPTLQFDQIRTTAEKVHRQKAARLVETMPWEAISHQLHVIHGKPTEAILKFADKHRSDLIVIGTVGQSGLAGILMGSTAEAIADKTRTSVLAIKPEDFVSPIKPD